MINRKIAYSKDWSLSVLLNDKNWGPVLRLADSVTIKTTDNEVTFLDINWRKNQFLLASMLCPRLTENKHEA